MVGFWKKKYDWARKTDGVALYHKLEWYKGVALCLFLVPVMLYFYTLHYFENKRLGKEGMRNAAMVDKIDPSTDSRYLGTINFHYEVGNIVYHCVKIGVQPETISALKVGESLPITYLPASPEKYRIELPVERKAGDDFMQSELIGGTIFFAVAMIIYLVPVLIHRKRIEQRANPADPPLSFS